MPGSQSAYILAGVSWQWWFVLAGVIFAVVGAVLAVVGFSRTWEDFRSDRKFPGVLISWVIAAGRQVPAVVIKLRDLLHLRRHGAAVGGATSRVSAGANVAWKILPAEYPEDKDLPNADFRAAS